MLPKFSQWTNFKTGRLSKISLRKIYHCKKFIGMCGESELSDQVVKNWAKDFQFGRETYEQGIGLGQPKTARLMNHCEIIC